MRPSLEPDADQGHHQGGWDEPEQSAGDQADNGHPGTPGPQRRRDGTPPHSLPFRHGATIVTIVHPDDGVDCRLFRYPVPPRSRIPALPTRVAAADTLGP